MSVNVWTTTPEGVHAEKLGTNGSQIMLNGYLLAAYAISGRSDSKRVCAWIGPNWCYRMWNGPWVPDAVRQAPKPVRNQPATVAALIAYSSDEDGDGTAESGYCMAQNDVIARGLKLRPVTDPMLHDLVELWEATWQGNSAVIPGATASRLSGHLTELLPLLETSESWHEALVAVADVFHAAACVGSDVHIG